MSVSALAEFKVDFLSDASLYRLKTTNMRSPLARAVGLKSDQALNVIDAMAGFGRDSFILAALGAHVCLLERSKEVATLLMDALERLGAVGDNNLRATAKRMTLHEVDAIAYMNALARADYPDVVYLDPMFAPRKKSAKVKKEAQLLQQLVGYPQAGEAEQVLAWALKVAQSRVVVKRAIDADRLTGVKPDFIIKASRIRFDIYRGGAV